MSNTAEDLIFPIEIDDPVDGAESMPPSNSEEEGPANETVPYVNDNEGNPAQGLARLTQAVEAAKSFDGSPSSPSPYTGLHTIIQWFSWVVRQVKSNRVKPADIPAYLDVITGAVREMMEARTFTTDELEELSDAYEAVLFQLHMHYVRNGFEQDGD